MAKTVADIMTTQVLTLREEDNLTALEPDMKLFGLRHLPVVDGDKLVGLLSHRDILRLAVSTLSHDPMNESVDRSHKANTFVAAVMHRDVLTIGPDTPITEAARVVVDNHVGCLPVVDSGMRLLGIVTEHDLLRELATSDEAASA